jgi:hypothetical protein
MQLMHAIEASTCFLQHAGAACGCNMQLQHASAALACNCSMQLQHAGAALACNCSPENADATYNCTGGLQYAVTTCRCNKYGCSWRIAIKNMQFQHESCLQHAGAACSCSMQLQHADATCRFSCNMQPQFAGLRFLHPFLACYFWRQRQYADEVSNSELEWQRAIAAAVAALLHAVAACRCVMKLQ